MKNEHKTSWGCVLCGTPTSILHEIFPGMGRKSICIKYNLQVPLCTKCHNMAHGRIRNEQVGDNQQEYYKMLFCNILQLGYYRTFQGVQHRYHRQYLEDKKDNNLKIIKSFEL